MSALAEPRTSVISNGRRQITSKYTDGSEVVEEYDVITDELQLRKSRMRTQLGGFSDWVIEIGSESHHKNINRELLVESNGSPEVVMQDSKECHVIRIRNLPYPKDVFSVTVERAGEDDPVGQVVVRTSNKKYFKRISIGEMQRAKIPLDASRLSFDVKHNTLIIEYKKHLSILAAEAALKKERASLPAKRIDGKEDAACAQQ